MSLSYKGKRIPLDILSDIELKDLKESLTVIPNVLSDYGPPEKFSVYRINSKYIYVPKFFNIDKYLSKFIFKEQSSIIENKERIGLDIDLKFTGNLRIDQIKFCDNILEHLDKNDSCIASAKTGVGKTTMALNLLSKISKKTLIIVHKEFLLNQWILRIKQFIPEARIGIIRANILDYQDKDIVIGMLQSLSMKDYDSKIFDEFGLVIIDECHHICSKTFSRALFKTGTKKMIGLSATPQRKDGLTIVLKWFLHDIISYVSSAQDLIEDPEIKIINAEYSEEITLKTNYMGKVILPDLINKISKDPLRNKMIVDNIIECVLQGRSIIVLSDRRQHCIELKNMVCAHTQFNGYTAGLYLGLMKQKELDKTNTCDVILATYSMAQEGYDNPKLDTLIMVTGKSDIEQAVGRILRQKNKMRPLIIDIADVKYCMGSVNRRKQFYRSKGLLKISKDKTNFKTVEIKADMFRI